MKVNQWSTSVCSRIVVPYSDWDSLARHLENTHRDRYINYSLIYLEVPALVVAPIDPPSVEKQVSWPQETATETLPDNAVPVIRAPIGGVVLLATSLVIMGRLIKSERRIRKLHCLA